MPGVFTKICLFARLALMGVLLASGLLARAEQPTALLELSFSRLGAEEGLPSLGVLSTYQDRQGLVWIGTTHGLLRYDGRHFKKFAADLDRPEALDHPVVQVLLEDERTASMWVGTDAGLNQVDLRSDHLRRHASPPELAAGKRRVVGLAVADAQTLWVASTGGLYLFDKALAAYRPWAPPQGAAQPASGPIRRMVGDGQGGVWLLQGHHALHVRADHSLAEAIDTRRGLGAQALSEIELQARALVFDGQGRLWLGLMGGMQVWRLQPDGQPARPDPLQLRLQLPRSRVVNLLRDAENNIWFTMNGDQGAGLHRWHAGSETVRHFAHYDAVPSSLASDLVSSLMQDRNGSLWVGSWGAGLSITDLGSGGFSRYVNLPGEPQTLSWPQVGAVAPDGAESLWVGTYGGGLNRVHLGSGRSERIPLAHLPMPLIKVLLPGDAGQLWVGGENGVLRYDSRRGRSQTVLTGKLSISSLLRDRGGSLWAGSSVGLYRFDRQDRLMRWFRADGNSGLASDTVDCLLEDHAGRLWVGSKGGLHLWDPVGERFSQPLRANAVLPRPERLAVQGLRQDDQGRIWLASPQGLFELVGQGEGWELKSMAELPGLPAASFESIQDAGNGDLWLGSELGLTRVETARGRARFYPGFARFGGGFEFGAVARGPDGSIFFGGSGVLRVRSEQLHDNPLKPELVLSDLRLFNQSLLPHAAGQGPGLGDVGISGPLHLARSLQLTHKQNMVSFELSALQFDKSRLNRYAWKLEGFDREWIFGEGDAGLATYTNLDPGRYRLLAKAANPDGLWGEPRELLSVVVAPPFWATWWARAAAALLLLLLLGTAYRLRVRALQQSRQWLEREVRSRTQQLLDQQQQLAHEKQLAVAQGMAAEKARRDIGLLSEIGRQITASLELEAIQQTLYRHVNGLIEAHVFGVGLVDWQARVVAFDYVMQEGEPLLPYQRSLDSLDQPAVQCALHGRELLLDELGQDNRLLTRPGAAEASRITLQDGAEPALSRSALYVPMMIKGVVIGVISVLNKRPRAFGNGDLDILRTLGAYAAVALDNAEAYRRLQLAQTRLVEQEKMAALGSLVAGVAHELNTPIGNSLLMASTLRDNSKRFLATVREGALRRSELERYCQGTEEASSLLVRSLGSAASLISSFKHLAVDQTSDQRRQFDLRGLCEELALTLGNRLRKDGHELQLDVPAELRMDSFPGALGQVLTNLILNAIVHGFEGRRQGQLQLRAQRLPGDWVRLELHDNGRGIHAESLGHVFEPFFTTKLGQGGSGLGLHISYNIVNAVLGGSITVRSEPGEGTSFEIRIPLTAP
ncbi:two-component regulator propeller domain-containing protein [Roseateles oligotrophus]|uniref:two-component regulator propeller domain-containing protein n=1 Tax=Roseateles oligotrophus TaxID=1769250 RepID=UPI001C88D0BF